jgi:Undecaprenyl-phosphate glucose phosphotransferase
MVARGSGNPNKQPAPQSQFPPIDPVTHLCLNAEHPRNLSFIQMTFAQYNPIETERRTNTSPSRILRVLIGRQYRQGTLEASDFLSVVAAGILAWITYQLVSGLEIAFWPNYAIATAISAPLAVFILRLSGCYGSRLLTQPWQTQAGTIVVGLLCFGATLLSAAYYTKVSDMYSRGWVTIWLSLIATTTVGVRIFYGWLDGRKSLAASYAERVAVVGAGEIGEYIFARLTAAGSDTNVVGIFDDRESRRAKSIEAHVRGTVKDLIEIASRTVLDTIVIALPAGTEKRLGEIVGQLRRLSAEILVLPGTAPPRYLESPVRRVGTLSAIEILARPFNDRSHLAKVLEDKIIGSFLLVFMLPLMIFIATAIRIESPGPILFRQKRRGFQHNLFMIYKFRTMYHEMADPSAEKLAVPNDARVTRVGRWLRRLSLDELPQLINVVRGDMSLVGPRPHAVNARAADQLYQEAVDEYASRYRVRPGITGWAQINGWRGGTETVEKLKKRVEYDLYYIENWSLTLDFKILWLTALRGFWHPNAY